MHKTFIRFIFPLGAAEETEIENVSDIHSNIELNRISVGSASELSFPDRLSVSSENEIQSKLEEDKPYDANTSEPLHEFPGAGDAS